MVNTVHIFFFNKFDIFFIELSRCFGKRPFNAYWEYFRESEDEIPEVKLHILGI